MTNVTTLPVVRVEREPQVPASAPIHFKRFPKRGMHWRTPDGVYFTHGPKIDKRIVQIVSVGPNPPHPNDIRAAFNKKEERDYRIIEACPLKPNTHGAVGSVAVLSRGFFSVIMKRDDVTDEQAQDVLNAGTRNPG